MEGESVKVFEALTKYVELEKGKRLYVSKLKEI